MGIICPSGGRARVRQALPMHAPRCAGVDAARTDPEGEVSPCFIETSARLTRAAISGGSAAAPRQLPLPSVCRARAAGSGRTGVARPALSPSEKNAALLDARCLLPACHRPAAPAHRRPRAALPPPDRLPPPLTALPLLPLPQVCRHQPADGGQRARQLGWQGPRRLGRQGQGARRLGWRQLGPGADCDPRAPARRGESRPYPAK